MNIRKGIVLGFLGVVSLFCVAAYSPTWFEGRFIEKTQTTLSVTANTTYTNTLPYPVLLVANGVIIADPGEHGQIDFFCDGNTPPTTRRGSIQLGVANLANLRVTNGAQIVYAVLPGQKIRFSTTNIAGTPSYELLDGVVHLVKL